MRDHIVRSFGEELSRLRVIIFEMGGIVAEQLNKSVHSLVEGDSELAQLIIEDDESVDKMQAVVDDLTVKLLVRRQPVAHDLRNIITAQKIASDLERVADYCSNIAKHVMELKNHEIDSPLDMISQMMDIAKEMLTDVMEAYKANDSETAKKAWCRDDEIDKLYVSLLNNLKDIMVEDTETIKDGTSLLFVARCCERIGDHITNIAEAIYFIKTGNKFDAQTCL